MNRLETIAQLNEMLLKDMPEYAPQARSFPMELISQRRLLRSLMNLRPPMPLKPDFCALQDALLGEERAERGIVHVLELPETADARLLLWQGDITRLDADVIVNAANSALLGCFCPCHGCIDNAIHSAAGLQLRDECALLMRSQGADEPTGRAKLTQAYNLPCRYVAHTVGPIVRGALTQADRDALAGCYRAVLRLVRERGLASVAFCCISTGEFHFPNREAAEIAVKTVREELGSAPGPRVIFNVFKDADLEIYRSLLGVNV